MPSLFINHETGGVGLPVEHKGNHQMTDTITIEGREYTWTVEYDCDIGAPWGKHDGHGPVTEWTTRPKGPGERVLAEDRGSYRYYDYAEACRIAKRDGNRAAEDGKNKRGVGGDP